MLRIARYCPFWDFSNWKTSLKIQRLRFLALQNYPLQMAINVFKIVNNGEIKEINVFEFEFEFECNYA